MSKYFDFNDTSDRSELINWLRSYSESEWQKLIDFSFKDDNRKNFTFDERKCLTVVKNYLRLNDFTAGQFKMVSWAYSIVQRINDLNSNAEMIEEFSGSREKDLHQPLRHFTLRVAWHDNKWNGTVCNDPEKNIYCNGFHSLLSDRIRREKEKIIDYEKKYSGQPVTKMITETGYFPPCFWSINAFGEDELNIEHYNPAARNVLNPIKDNLPAYSMFSWPFAFSFVRNSDEFKTDGKYPATLEKVRVPRFRNKIKENQSIAFIYAKYSNPLSLEEMKYLLVGCGIIKDKGESTYFEPIAEIEKIRNKNKDLRNFPSINWVIKYSFDPNTLVRIPYQEYINEAKRRSLNTEESDLFLSKIKVTIDEPELNHCFKYVNMDIDDDEAIFLLTKIRQKLIEAQNDGIVEMSELNNQVKKTDYLLELCWNRRTHFPGFKNLSRALLQISEDELCILDKFVEIVKGTEPDYCGKIKELILEPKSDSTYARFTSKLIDLNKAISVLNLSVDQFLLLSMLNLSLHQFDKIKRGDINGKRFGNSIADICNNPYLLYEEYEVDEEPQEKLTGDYIDYDIELFKIDIALYPNTDYLSYNYLQEPLQITDNRRIRALIIQYLRSLELSMGHCFDDADSIQTVLEKYPLFYKSSATYTLPEFFLLKTNPDYDKLLAEKLEIVFAHDTKYYYLKEVYDAEKSIANFIKKLLNNTEPNTLLFDDLDKYLAISIEKLKKKIKEGFEEDSFVSERTELYTNIFPKKFYVISGNPGSGKSYEILNIIKYFADKGESYILLAPTGKATLRLKFDEDFRQYNIQAMTIDKFINQWKKYPENRKSYNNIIIDEMSMVDLMKLNTVLNFFDPSDPSIHRVIFVGDPNQLPPIGYGKPFYDTIRFLKSDGKYISHLMELDTNCRKELAENEILEFSKYFTNESDLNDEIISKITNGDKISEGFRVKYFADEDKLKEILEEEWLRLADEFGHKGTKEDKLNRMFNILIDENEPSNTIFDMEAFQVITPYRVTSEYINDYYQNTIRENQESDILKLFKHLDKIIRTQNYYDKKDLILSNGSIGLALQAKKNKILCFPELSDKFIPTYGENGIRDREKEFFELAYCVTVHKSQGSGFDHLIVILPKRYAVLSRELFYTALTRSKKSISILVEGEPGGEFEKSLFEYARKRSYTENRKTSLLLDQPEQYYGLEPEQGIFVQSRVEQIIYKHLMNYREKYSEEGFDFRYEQYPVINDKKVRVKTDFTIYTKYGAFYWEHLGMLSKSSYKKKWLDIRFPIYEKSGLRDRLITTDELRGINDDKIDSIVEAIRTNNIGNEDRYKLFSDHHYSLR